MKPNVLHSIQNGAVDSRIVESRDNFVSIDDLMQSLISLLEQTTKEIIKNSNGTIQSPSDYYRTDEALGNFPAFIIRAHASDENYIVYGTDYLRLYRGKWLSNGLIDFIS